MITLLLLLRDKLKPTNESVASAQSLGLMLLSSSLQIDNDSISVLHSIKFTFQPNVKVECFKLIEEVVNFCDVSQLQSFAASFTK